MSWIHNYQLFLFDFDGILVDTEELHYKAYLHMCASRGFPLKWDRHTYMQYALYTATGVREGIYRELPGLQKEEPCWDVLYQEKRRAYSQLLHNEGTALMPGVEKLLKDLVHAGIKRCVVTHSPAEQIELIRAQHPILNSIPEWVTREDYIEPKPSSECYEKAIAKLKAPGDRIIGFEDSPRGLKALLGTEAEGVLVTDYLRSSEIQALSETMERQFLHYSSFERVFC